MKSTFPLVALSLLPLGVLSAGLRAQPPAPGSVVGWAWNNGPLTVCSQVYTQDVDNACQRAVGWGSSLCSQKGTGGGGTAYDPRSQSAWVSEGTSIALHDLAGKRITCQVNATLAAPGNVVTGLALADATRELFQLEVGPGVLYLSSYDVSTACTPRHKQNWCRAPLVGTGAVAMGLGYDEARRLLYYSISISGLLSWSNTVHVTTPGSMCTDLGTFPVNHCGPGRGGPIAGLGYDSCSQKLYCASETGIRVMQLLDPANGRVTDLTGTNPCCVFTGTGIWMGLAVVPSWRQNDVGSGCLDAACGTCKPLLRTTGGDASLGNQDFGFRLTGAPGGSQGLFYVALGNCTGGVQIPGLCGPVYPSLTPPWPLLVGAFGTGGTTGLCDGAAAVKTGVPADPALCAVSLCGQWLVLCPTGGWSGLSNAVELTFGG